MPVSARRTIGWVVRSCTRKSANGVITNHADIGDGIVEIPRELHPGQRRKGKRERGSPGTPAVSREKEFEGRRQPHARDVLQVRRPDELNGWFGTIGGVAVRCTVKERWVAGTAKVWSRFKEHAHGFPGHWPVNVIRIRGIGAEDSPLRSDRAVPGMAAVGRSLDIVVLGA